MSRQDKENTIYRYLDRFPNGVTGTYRDLEEQLGIDHVTIMRIVKDSPDIKATVRGVGNEKESHFILVKNETKTNNAIKQKIAPIENPIETIEVRFNTRQHKLIDYLLLHCLGKNNRMDKVDLLWELREEYFECTDIGLPYGVMKPVNGTSKDDLKKSRHNYAEYVRLTNDISFINMHGELRQILIGSQGGHGGGVWALRVGEQHDAIDKIFGDGLKLLKKGWAMKKAAEKHANTRLVFNNEKNIMDILREFDN